MHATSTRATPRQASFVCPFCGLLCDDMRDPGPTVDMTAWSRELQALCPRASAGLAALAGADPQAAIDGHDAAAAAALAEAARRLAGARRPVIGGLGADVQATRAALALADRLGARVTHRNQFVAQRNLFAVQGRGALTTTLAEVKNRAELVLVVGGDVTSNFPRLLERVFAPAPVFADAAARRLVLLGAAVPQRVPAGVAVERLETGDLDLFDAVAVLRACVLNQPVAARGPATDAMAAFAQRMRDCRYGAVVWAAADLPAAGGDLLVEQLHQLTIDLNRATRWAALPLGGNDGDLSANAVATWQTGFPLPIEFANGRVGYDPHPDYADADLLVWISALPGVGAPQLPGAPAGLPAIVIGARPRAGSHEAALPARHVFLPAATPGLTASGHLVRTDGVITLYAPGVRPSALSPAAAVIDRLAAAVAGVRP